MALNRSNSVGMGRKRAVGVFPNLQVTEQALRELRDSGFPMDRVSVIARDAERKEDLSGAQIDRHAGNKADKGATAGAVSGGTLGGITGLLVGLGLLAIPGIGPVMLAGAGATALATTLAGGAIGAAAGGLLGALVGLGIPEDRAKVYNDRVSRGEYLVMVDGSDEEIAQAETILSRRGIQEWGIYDAGTETTLSDTVDRPVVAPTPHQPMSATDTQSIPLYEERLMADKDRAKVGEVTLGKHVETETARVSVPVETERVVIERVNSTDMGKPVAPGEATFQAGETVRMEVYEETADIHKEAFIREEVTIRKEVDQKVVSAEETLRKEEIDIDTQGLPKQDIAQPKRSGDRF